MTEAFGRYSYFYDLIYREKDYETECDYLEQLFGRFSVTPVKSLLDLGCGTGGHALLMARRGYEVTGVDMSELMLQKAKEKAAEQRLSVEFLLSDIRRLDVGCSFDAVISMFAVISYQTTNEDLLDAFGSVRRHIKEGGIFIFDSWHGPAVLFERPGERLREFESETHKVYRFARPVLHVEKNMVEVNYTVLSRDKSTDIVKEVKEKHQVRYLFSQEVELLARLKGFGLLATYPFMTMEEGVSEKNWNVTFVLKAV